MPAQNNPFESFLNDQPNAGYFSYQDQWKTPNAKKYYMQQFGAIQDQYMGQLGKQIRTGQDATLFFFVFLIQYGWG